MHAQAVLDRILYEKKGIAFFFLASCMLRVAGNGIVTRTPPFPHGGYLQSTLTTPKPVASRQSTWKQQEARIEDGEDNDETYEQVILDNRRESRCTMKQVPSLISIPDDQWQLILSFTCLRTLMILTLVSKDVNAIALKSHHLTTTSNLALSKEQLGSTLQRFRSLRVLKLTELQEVGDDLIPVLNKSNLTFLVHLELRDVRMYKNDHSLCLSRSRDRLGHSKLEVIKIEGVIFSRFDPVLLSFTQSSRNLKLLQLDGCRSMVDENAAQISLSLGENANLRHLSLRGNSKLHNPSIGPCPHLRSLSLQKCVQLQSLPKLSCPNLLKLDLSYCSIFRQDAVKEIIENCSELTELIMKRCDNLKTIEINASKLQLLDLSWCNGLEYCQINCQWIQRLHLGGCLKLKSANLKLPRIKSLDLSMLKMEELLLEAYELNALYLSGNFNLTNEHFTCDCPNLLKVDICGTDLVWNSSILGCRNRNSLRQGIKHKVNVESGGEAHNWLE